MRLSRLTVRRGTRKTLPADARTAFGFQALTVPGKQMTAVGSECFGGAQDGSKVARVLQCQQGRRSAARAVRLPRICAHVQSGGSTRAATGCGRLGCEGGRPAVRAASAALQCPAGRSAVQAGAQNPAPTKTQRMCKPGAHGFFKQVRPFDADKPGRVARDWRAPAAIPSTARSAYSVQCE